MSEQATERMDDMIMATRDIHCLVLVAPVECRPKDNGGRYGPEKTPGVYIKQHGHGMSPAATPNNEMRLLSKDDALLVAAAIDKVSRPQPHGSGAFNRGTSPDAAFPCSYVEFIERWYAVLARRLGRAIDATEARRSELRELRAALTGSVQS